MTMQGGQAKFARDYSQAERELFAAYVAQRAKFRPKRCTDCATCWVRCGPPCYRTTNTSGACVGCGAAIKIRLDPEAIP